MHIDKYRNTDPDAGFADGFRYPPNEHYCDYDTALSLIQCGILGFCGCGRPRENLEFIRDGLALIDIRFEGDPRKNRAAWDTHLDRIKQEERRIFGSEGAAYFFYYWADKEGLTEHGGSVPGWLDVKGKELLDDLNELLATLAEDD